MRESIRKFFAGVGIIAATTSPLNAKENSRDVSKSRSTVVETLKKADLLRAAVCYQKVMKLKNPQTILKG